MDAQEFKDLQAKGDLYMIVGNAGLITGGVLARGSVVLSLFTDWDEVGEELEDE